MSEPTPRDEGRSAPLRRRRFFKIGYWLLLLTLIGYAASNLWLSSPWGTAMAERKLKERTGMDWAVDSMSWSPWNGFTVKGASMLQPDALREKLDQPLLEVEEIQIQPHWGPLFRGHARPREVTMQRPKVMLSVEMLAAIASQSSPQEVVQVQPKTEPATTPPKPTAKTPSQPSSSPKQPKPTVAKKPKSKETQTTAEQARPPAGLPIRVVVTDARVELVSLAKGIELLDVNGLDLDLPIFGEDAEGLVRIAELKVPGIERLAGIEQKVVWKRPYLEIEPQSIDLGGLKVKGLAQLNLSGMRPFLIDLSMPPQAVDQLPWLERFAADVKAEQASGRLQITGSVTHPMSWRAGMVAQASQVELKELHGNNVIRFDEVSVPAMFQQGRFRWSSVRVIGEDLSVLGNGSVSLHEGVNSVTRLVASPELAVVLKNAMIGAGMVSRRRWWEDLDTPDRQYRDIYVRGSLIDPQVDLSAQHTDVPLWQALASVMHFIRVEMSEEGVELKPLPNQELLNTRYHENH
ncbi:hypothetical protein JO972_14060 [Verrucomicrobiaceae bacterium 5K15]|uniref:Uncharacterized protein n=1 Tax=Oceaniferula flava TaxID=2800421 RepID=A0AAE2V8V9_9BACT|nr:hypothetical protein [Oceaniferula flavus]MBK1856092.1 hypothetical protein [Oceaniferula flavus]MBM1137399.1 hypothetical protein [Oceaniferula flavus]